MPYRVFEDQRSGETLGKLQKVRTDVEIHDQCAAGAIGIDLVTAQVVLKPGGGTIDDGGGVDG